ncbi:Guanine nucleotide-binding protein subunit beta-2-like 1 [Hondaea fermentalgiana]|uniref:Guanine nucleotide-binding protein subunit beta-2-like 1 n=1 Tax=Hondaea fermentalgiana TaxID=2315210 RepID=A0A2R5GYI0_9STRA|nr:Guanine nucleotide-binding protein subunit beta-2-like 1 [Hondaea fermentalgiana]|eukprot:GBG34868.1 Guanine nucleotide-binding protein subunit beta-2-like 1 [Hondaea fermentalgiana]
MAVLATAAARRDKAQQQRKDDQREAAAAAAAAAAADASASLSRPLALEDQSQKDPASAQTEETRLVAVDPKSAKRERNDRLRRLGAADFVEQESRALQTRRKAPEPIKPEWHAPWKLHKVLPGHLGWVRCVAVDPSNRFFFTGSADRTIICWDLATGERKLTLTAHSHGVRGLATSAKYPYLFSVGEDKTVKCWDLETNRVVRDYHGHLQGVHCVAMHPTLDVIVTGGRDAAARVWDIRTRKEVHLLTGHEDSVESLIVQSADPQIITGSMDKTIKLWDLAAGKVLTTLTNHKKGIRALTRNPREFSFASGAADCIKKWQCKDGRFMLNMPGPGAIINALSVNSSNVLFSGAQDGTMQFWDWASGHCFQSFRTTPQPGSLDSEACVLASAFDMTGSRLITCEADKSVKIWRQDRDATEESFPLQWDRDAAAKALLDNRY